MNIQLINKIASQVLKVESVCVPISDHWDNIGKKKINLTTQLMIKIEKRIDDRVECLGKNIWKSATGNLEFFENESILSASVSLCYDSSITHFGCL